MAVVATIPKASELAALSVQERLDLLDEIWNSLTPVADSLPVPEWHRVEIERRLGAFEADDNPGRPADEVFRDLKKRF